MATSFVEKLRLNSLYPTLPFKKRREDEELPIQPQSLPPNPYDAYNAEQNRVRQIGEGLLGKPKDVVFDQGSISETARGIGAARAIHGVDLQKNSLSPYQAGQLDNRERELGIREAQYNQTNQMGQQRIDETARMNDFKMKNPGMQVVTMRGGDVVAMDKAGNIVSRLGPSGLQTDEQKSNSAAANDKALETQRQAGRMEVVQGQGDNQINNIRATAGNKPIGTNRSVKYEYSPDGSRIIGARSETRDEMPELTANDRAVLMYTPDGKGPFDIPLDKIDDAQARGMKFNRSGGK